MKTVKLKGLVIEYHDGDIEEMPIHRSQLFNQQMAIEAGIGSNMEAFDHHLVKMNQFVKRKMFAEYETEVANIRQNLYFVINNVSPRTSAFVYLINTIDGEELTDFSPENVARLTQRFGRAGLTARMIVAIIDLVKKNVARDLADHFPKMMANAKQNELNHRMTERSRAIIAGILSDQEPTKMMAVVDDIDEGLLQLQKPSKFTGPNGVEAVMKRIYERTVAHISEMIGRDAKALTIMEYYTYVHILQARVKAQTKKK